MNKENQKPVLANICKSPISIPMQPQRQQQLVSAAQIIQPQAINSQKKSAAQLTVKKTAQNLAESNLNSAQLPYELTLRKISSSKQPLTNTSISLQENLINKDQGQGFEEARERIFEQIDSPKSTRLEEAPLILRKINTTSPESSQSAEAQEDQLSAYEDQLSEKMQANAVILSHKSQTAEPTGAAVYSRKEKSLGELCRRFLQHYGIEGKGTLLLDQCTKELGVERRRIYDIINILESFFVIRRRAKNEYAWRGIYKIVESIKAQIQQGQQHQFTQSAANESKSGCQNAHFSSQEPSKNILNDQKVKESSVLSNQVSVGARTDQFNGQNSKFEKITCQNLKRGFNSLSTYKLIELVSDNEEEFNEECITSQAIGRQQCSRKNRRQPKYKKVKSLGSFCQQFIHLFVGWKSVISLEEAARQISGSVDGEEDDDDIDEKMLKTKIRRLYDIANVLQSIGLIYKTHMSSSRKPAFQWVGIEGVYRAIKDILLVVQSNVNPNSALFVSELQQNTAQEQNSKNLNTQTSSLVKKQTKANTKAIKGPDSIQVEPNFAQSTGNSSQQVNLGCTPSTSIQISPQTESSSPNRINVKGIKLGKRSSNAILQDDPAQMFTQNSSVLKNDANNQQKIDDKAQSAQDAKCNGKVDDVTNQSKSRISKPNSQAQEAIKQSPSNLKVQEFKLIHNTSEPIQTKLSTKATGVSGKRAQKELQKQIFDPNLSIRKQSSASFTSALNNDQGLNSFKSSRLSDFMQEKKYQPLPLQMTQKIFNSVDLNQLQAAKNYLNTKSGFVSRGLDRSDSLNIAFGNPDQMKLNQAIGVCDTRLKQVTQGITFSPLLLQQSGSQNRIKVNQNDVQGIKQLSMQFQGRRNSAFQPVTPKQNINASAGERSPLMAGTLGLSLTHSNSVNFMGGLKQNMMPPISSLWQTQGQTGHLSQSANPNAQTSNGDGQNVKGVVGQSAFRPASSINEVSSKISVNQN